MVKVDPKDAYFTVPVWKNHQKFLRFVRKETMYEFACLPFGLASAPTVFTKLMKPVVGLLLQLGVRLIVYLDDMLIMAQTRDIALQHASTALDKLSEVSPSPFHKDGISRICSKLPHSVPCTPSGQNHESKKGVSDLTGLATSNCETTSKITGTPYVYHSSCLSRAPPLPPLAKREKQGFSTFSNLRLHYSPLPSGPRGIGLVEGQPGSMERKSSGFGLPRLSNRDRCLLTRLGGILQRSVHRGSVVSRGISFPHKLSRTSGWGICCQDLCERQSSNASPIVNGQFDCHPLYKQDGGHKIPCSGTSGIRSMEVVPSPQNPYRGQGVLNIRADRESRVFLDHHDWKLDPLLFAELNQVWGPLEGRPVCPLGSQLPRFYSWRPDPLSEVVDAFSQDWSKVRGYPFPPFALVGRCLRQLLDTECVTPCSSRTGVAVTAMVPSASRVVCSTSRSVPSLPGPADTTRGSPPLVEASTSRLATIRQSYAEAGISQLAQTLLVAGLEGWNIQSLCINLGKMG